MPAKTMQAKKIPTKDAGKKRKRCWQKEDADQKNPSQNMLAKNEKDVGQRDAAIQKDIDQKDA